MSKKSKKREQEIVWTSTDGLPKWNQSPVDLNRLYTVHDKFPPLYLQGHLSNKRLAKMTNNGKTVTIGFDGEGLAGYLIGGPLEAAYQFAELQFRWGETDARGAEHTIDGTWFSMEAQAMHWNTNYGAIGNCYDKLDGIAIVSFLFQVIGCPGISDNKDFSIITDKLCNIAIPTRSVDLPPNCFKWMMEACQRPGYYTYTGSLTTYPYPQCVTWIVLPQPIEISARQADAFRNLYNVRGDKILNNCRPEQKIRNRKVYFAVD